MYASLVRNVLFPLHERIKGHSTLAAFSSLNETQWLSPISLREYQDHALRQFLTAVRNNVPYYRDIFISRDFDPSKANYDSLITLPTLTKELIRQHSESLRAENARNLQKSHTGGSTGAPLAFYLSKERVSHDVAAKLRSYRWWNVSFGDPEIVIWGAPHELKSQDRVRQFRDLIFRSQLVPAFSMSETDVKRYIDIIRSKRPKIIFGYPSAIHRICTIAEASNIPLNALGVKVIFTTAERLFDHQRAAIQDSFDARVANGYGGRDAGFIAHECPHGGMHITADDILVEILDDDGNRVEAGTPGEITVTHLRNRDFPFIRYRTGDIGALSTNICPCGRGLPLLDRIDGRTTDFVIASNGTQIHALALIYPLRSIEKIREFKIVQRSLTYTEVTLDAIDLNDLDRKQIINEFKNILGEDVNIDLIEQCPIPREKSGKFRYVRSEVEGAAVA